MWSRVLKFFRGSQYENLDGANSHEKDVIDIYEGVDEILSPEHNTDNKNAEGTFTIEQAIDQIGFGQFQVKLSILTGIAWVCGD
ncbi:hypothetical protein ACOMHN_016934 [Nucella lapillus]